MIDPRANAFRDKWVEVDTPFELKPSNYIKQFFCGIFGGHITLCVRSGDSLNYHCPKCQKLFSTIQVRR